LVPQLVVELDEPLSQALAGAFGDGAFEGWVRRMRDRGFMVDAWSDQEEPPPLFFMLSADLEDRLTTDEDRAAMERVEFDEDGVARSERFAIKVVPVDTGFRDVAVKVGAWVTAVCGQGGSPSESRMSVSTNRWNTVHVAPTKRTPVVGIAGG